MTLYDPVANTRVAGPNLTGNLGRGPPSSDPMGALARRPRQQRL
jgi:hypothetical protein